MPQFSALIVGAHFRPPAKLLLSSVPAGCPLSLELEPENEYDPFAIKVLLDPAEVPEAERENLRPALEGYGTSWDELLAAGPRHVGYVQSNVTAKQPLPEGFITAPRLQPLLAAMQHTYDGEYVTPISDFAPITLSFTPAGAPVVSILWGYP